MKLQFHLIERKAWTTVAVEKLISGIVASLYMIQHEQNFKLHSLCCSQMNSYAVVQYFYNVHMLIKYVELFVSTSSYFFCSN